MNAKTLSLDSECPHGSVNALNPAAAGVGDLESVCPYVLHARMFLCSACADKATHAAAMARIEVMEGDVQSARGGDQREKTKSAGTINSSSDDDETSSEVMSPRVGAAVAPKKPRDKDDMSMPSPADIDTSQDEAPAKDKMRVREKGPASESHNQQQNDPDQPDSSPETGDSDAKEEDNFAGSVPPSAESNDEEADGECVCVGLRRVGAHADNLYCKRSASESCS